jgi:hypothetical protein
MRARAYANNSSTRARMHKHASTPEMYVHTIAAQAHAPPDAHSPLDAYVRTYTYKRTHAHMHTMSITFEAAPTHTHTCVIASRAGMRPQNHFNLKNI